MQRWTKVSLIVFLFTLSSRAWAFDRLVCEGDLDVRLNPGGKKASAKSFTIKKKDALELEISIEGDLLGQIFPWDHVVWQPAQPATTKTATSASGFSDVKFKTDDATLIDLSAVAAKSKKTRTLHCVFRDS